MNLAKFIASARRAESPGAFLQGVGRWFFRFDWLRAGEGVVVTPEADGATIGVDVAGLTQRVESINGNDTKKVKADDADPAPGYLVDKVDGATIVVTDADQLAVPVGGIGAEQLADYAVTADKLAEETLAARVEGAAPWIGTQQKSGGVEVYHTGPDTEGDAWKTFYVLAADTGDTRWAITVDERGHLRTVAGDAPPPPEVELTVELADDGAGTLTATASGGSGSYPAYAFERDGAIVQDGAANTHDYSGLAQGTYSFRVRVTDSAGRVAWSDAVQVSVAGDIPGFLDLKLWYVAGAESDAPGNPVVQLTDQSGHARHATQATAAKRATMAADGLAYAFDGIDDYYVMTGCEPLYQGEVTMLAVWRNTNNGNLHGVYEQYGGHWTQKKGGSLYFRLGNTLRWGCEPGGDADNYGSRDVGVTFSGTHHALVVAYHDGSNYCASWADGAANGTNHDNPPVYTPSGATNDLYFGALHYTDTGNPGGHVEAEILEYALWDGELDAATRTSLFAYLQTKYGI